MVVYVEYVFLDNFIIDLMLISLSRRALGLERKKRCLIISSLFGGLVAVVYPLLHLSVAVGFALKMPIGLMIVLLSGKFRRLKEYVRCFYLFLFFTFCFGGLATAVFWGLGLSFDPISFSNANEIPLFLILSVLLAGYFLTVRVVGFIYKKRAIVRFLMKCFVQIDGKTFELTGFFDSGNGLSYKKTCSPIALCSASVGKRLKEVGVLENTKQDDITVNTVSGKCVIPIYKTQKFLIYNGDEPNILYNVMIGVSDSNLSPGGEYDLLIGPLLT